MNMKATLIDHDIVPAQVSTRQAPGLTLIDGASSRALAVQLVGRSPALRELSKRIELVAPTDSNVLIHGETGTGKELIARAIHRQSSRRGGPFVALNVAAIPSNLLESEIFGHERGAFTGAVARRIGRFEEAQQGTIFLDEIGELHPDLQPKLLRLLQEHEFQRIGGSKTLACNARLIAASNRDLRDLVEVKQFRADLFYRLSVFPIYSPALRERVEDIPSLVGHFMAQLARRLDRPQLTVSAQTMLALVPP
jgi:formate hydrogenlyase transcriptional activator